MDDVPAAIGEQVSARDLRQAGLRGLGAGALAALIALDGAGWPALRAGASLASALFVPGALEGSLTRRRVGPTRAAGHAALVWGCVAAGVVVAGRDPRGGLDPRALPWQALWLGVPLGLPLALASWLRIVNEHRPGSLGNPTCGQLLVGLSLSGAAGALIGLGGWARGLWSPGPADWLVAGVWGAGLGTLAPLLLLAATFAVLVWWSLADGLEELAFPRGAEPPP